MKNLHAYGIPYSIFFEDLFAKTYDSTKLEEDQQRIQQFYQDNGYFTGARPPARRWTSSTWAAANSGCR